MHLRYEDADSLRREPYANRYTGLSAQTHQIIQRHQLDLASRDFRDAGLSNAQAFRRLCLRQVFAFHPDAQGFRRRSGMGRLRFRPAACRQNEEDGRAA